MSLYDKEGPAVGHACVDKGSVTRYSDPEPSSNYNSELVAKDSNGEIESEHRQLKRSIERLGDKVDLLKERLKPVRSEVPLDKADGGSRLKASSPLAASIQEDSIKVDYLTDLITDLLSELALP